LAEVRLTSSAGLGVRRGGIGRPVVLLHGWAMSGAVFDELLAAPPEGLELIAVDLPGHGGAITAVEQNLDGWTECVEAALAELALDSCPLLGWSLGGMLALHLADRGRFVPERLVLVGSTPRFTVAEGWPCGVPMLQLRAMQRDLQREFRPTLERLFSLMFAPGEIDRRRYREIARFAAGPKLLPGVASAAAGLRILQHADLRGLLPEIDCPCLVMHGEHDPVIPFDAGRELARALSAARFEAIAGCGHAPFLTRPDLFRRLLAEFCA